MVSTVRSRPNLYETLGLTPTATDEDIAQAFARQLRRPLPFGGIAQVSVAYETLRNAAKRRAYDSSIGIAPEPQPQSQSQSQSTYRLSAQPIGAAFMRTATASPAAATPKPSVPTGDGQPQPDLSSERRLPASIAAALHDIAKREPLHETGPQKVQPDGREPSQADLTSEKQEREQQATAGAGPVHRALEHSLDDDDGSSVDWKRPTMIIGAALAAASLIGIWAGSDLRSQPPQQLQPVAKAWLPPARPPAISVGEPNRVAAPAVGVRLQQPTRATGAASPTVEGRPLIKPLTRPPARQTSEPTASGLNQVAASQAPPAVATPAVADPTTASSAEAALPLPKKVIARTIERIGYACGQVTSISAVEGGMPGVFKVTCTSGQGYVASPVRGRYHFRRSDR